jgi:hypothetical protein
MPEGVEWAVSQQKTVTCLHTPEGSNTHTRHASGKATSVRGVGEAPGALHRRCAASPTWS